MRRDDQRLNDILEALDWIAKAVSGRTKPTSWPTTRSQGSRSVARIAAIRKEGT
jgi:hypothetical protein